ncbi:hypothetical protein BVRB_8g186500 [Beta vulgaris subsp. vulgaris]|uniref:Uncharacterized protein n=1 Tax=Beta vulgaris subsp. vulgaris TaxID=3555 RepID=A0A0J8BVX0_BETVV|nr:hypothetical protein BVRB_8g186500 [Beta vulgaris subsp. vulgaris]
MFALLLRNPRRLAVAGAAVVLLLLLFRWLLLMVVFVIDISSLLYLSLPCSCRRCCFVMVRCCHFELH